LRPVIKLPTRAMQTKNSVMAMMIGSFLKNLKKTNVVTPIRARLATQLGRVMPDKPSTIWIRNMTRIEPIDVMADHKSFRESIQLPDDCVLIFSARKYPSGNPAASVVPVKLATVWAFNAMLMMMSIGTTTFRVKG